MTCDLDSWPCGLVRIADDGRILAINHGLLGDVGYAAEELLQRPIDVLLPAGSRLFFYSHLLPLLTVKGSAAEIYLPLRSRQGAELPMLVNAARRDGAAGRHYDCAFFLTSARADYEARLLAAKKAADDARARNAALAERLAAMREELRQSLGHTLHESLAQEISGLKWGLESLRGAVAAADGSLAGRLDELVAAAGATLTQVRRLSYELRPPELRQLGFRAAVQRHAETVAAAAGIEVEIVGGERLPGLGEASQIVLFRAVEEALSNVARHARARRVILEMSHDSGTVSVAIEDDGIGMDGAVAARPESLGIAAIAARLASVGGELALRTAPGQGCRIEARVPRARAGDDRVSLRPGRRQPAVRGIAARV
jgi:signal transduction histidine kinase